jgi:hypothetical protein
LLTIPLCLDQQSTTERSRGHPFPIPTWVFILFAVAGPWNLCVAKKVAITVRLAPEMIFEWPALEQIPFKERRTPGARLPQVVISCAKRRF